MIFGKTNNSIMMLKINFNTKYIETIENLLYGLIFMAFLMHQNDRY